MSRAKKTKRTKKYSADNYYRRITEVLNHAKKVEKENNQPPAQSERRDTK